MCGRWDVWSGSFWFLVIYSSVWVLSGLLVVRLGCFSLKPLGDY